jgi:hypothetical protein
MFPNSAIPRTVCSSPRRAHELLLNVVLLLAAFYSAVYCIQFLSSPIGRYPVLDGAENARFAKELASGTLAHEPFYRAMLYPALLSLFLRCGFPVVSITTLGAVLGWLFHLASTLCVYRIARRVWRSARAGLLAAALFGLNPVAVYFSAELLDTGFALFLFLTGVMVLHDALSRPAASPFARHIRAELPRTSIGDASFITRIITATALLTLATLARPHYLMALLAIPIALVMASLTRRTPRKDCLGGPVERLHSLGRAFQSLAASLVVRGFVAWLLAAGLLLGANGLLQKHLCGRFQLMPTQGGYSLWVGNRPGANGRYYEQQIHIPPTAGIEGENPARIEADLLYAAETGAPATDPLRVSHYWRQKTLTAILSAPLAWAKLMARKIYYLLNDFEQYNNKTFAIQKQPFPVLGLNPLGWGLTLMLCSAALAACFGSGAKPVGALPLGLLAGAYAAGVIVFFVSDRFRLPLLPFLCAGAGGCVRFLPRGLPSARSLSLQPLLAPLAAGSIACAVAFSRFADVHDLSPAAQDYVLLSIAAEKSGKDFDALTWARTALERRPDHPDALACAITSFYNAELQGLHPERVWPEETWALQVRRAAMIAQPAESVQVVHAVALWKKGQTVEAQQTLRSLVDGAGRAAQSSATRTALWTRAADDALGILLLTRLERPGDLVNASQRAQSTSSFYLLAASETRGDANLPKTTGQKQLVEQATPLLQNLLLSEATH